MSSDAACSAKHSISRWGIRSHRSEGCYSPAAPALVSTSQIPSHPSALHLNVSNRREHGLHEEREEQSGSDTSSCVGVCPAVPRVFSSFRFGQDRFGPGPVPGTRGSEAHIWQRDPLRRAADALLSIRAGEMARVARRQAEVGQAEAAAWRSTKP